MKKQNNWIISRRVFLRSSTLAAAALSAGATLPSYADSSSRKAKLRFGIVTDSHYADAPAKGRRCYRKSMGKMQECVDLMNEQKVDFLIELGDFKDQGSPSSEKSTLKFLDAIESVFSKFKGPRYHVLGNHDADSISKSQFLAHVDNTGISKESSFYSYDTKGVHCVVLDANFKSDGIAYNHGNYNWKDANISEEEVKWLKHDLAATKLPVLCFIHQELNGGGHRITNADQVCKILAESNRVLAVFQGHHHEGAYKHLENIHYYTLKCMVDDTKKDNNSYAVVDMYADNSMMVTGYCRADSKSLSIA
ncbi:MAG: metallophosphoesterase [Kiritimatiellae bacterium]|jgi:predicted phosphodiesterase|nr:metallophosphoesterase [Kiritimatiellia bacterium]